MKPRVTAAVPLLGVLAATVMIQASAQAPRPDRPLTLAEIAMAYPSFQRITEWPVYVNGELAMQCAPVRPAQIEAAAAQHGPHARAAILVFMNDSAARAFAARSGKYPVGAVVVKHKTISSGFSGPVPGVASSFGVGGMVKRAPGFDPEHGDWEYFYFEDPAKIEGGRIRTCVECHASAKKTDYVFGTWKQ